MIGSEWTPAQARLVHPGDNPTPVDGYEPIDVRIRLIGTTFQIDRRVSWVTRSPAEVALGVYHGDQLQWWQDPVRVLPGCDPYWEPAVTGGRSVAPLAAPKVAPPIS